MIDIVCDNCESTFTVEGSLAGGKAPCPKCGDVNRVPEAHGPQSLGLPPEEGPEVEILAVRPAMFRARPVWFSMMVLLVVAGVSGAAAGTAKEMPWLTWLSVGGAAAGMGWWTVWYVRHLCEHLLITNKRTIYRRGLLSRHTSEVLHDHIRNIQIRQSFVERIFGVGEVLLDSSAGGGSGTGASAAASAEIRIVDIPRPGRLKEIIDQYRTF